MKILLSNDDGYRAEGLTALAAAIRPLGAVTIVAPDRNRSCASNSLTLDVPVRAARYDTDAYYVNGTPTDCVHLAISGLFDFEHDIVVSGVNDGANLGDDTLYSGTVAAAVEARNRPDKSRRANVATTSVRMSTMMPAASKMRLSSSS